MIGELQTPPPFQTGEGQGKGEPKGRRGFMKNKVEIFKSKKKVMGWEF